MPSVRVILDSNHGLFTEVEIACKFTLEDIEEKLKTASTAVLNAYKTAYLTHGPAPEEGDLGS